MQRIESLKNIKQITTEYFTAAHMAGRTPDKPVVYLNVFTPVEIFYAMDIFPVYPENHAAICGARKVTKDLAPAAEGMGYSMDLCAYARCDLGWIKTGMSPTFGLPKPDLLVVCPMRNAERSPSGLKCSAAYTMFRCFLSTFRTPAAEKKTRQRNATCGTRSKS